MQAMPLVSALHKGNVSVDDMLNLSQLGYDTDHHPLALVLGTAVLGQVALNPGRHFALALWY